MDSPKQDYLSASRVVGHRAGSARWRVVGRGVICIPRLGRHRGSWWRRHQQFLPALTAFGFSAGKLVLKVVALRTLRAPRDEYGAVLAYSVSVKVSSKKS